MSLSPLQKLAPQFPSTFGAGTGVAQAASAPSQAPTTLGTFARAADAEALGVPSTPFDTAQAFARTGATSAVQQPLSPTYRLGGYAKLTGTIDVETLPLEIFPAKTYTWLVLDYPIELDGELVTLVRVDQQKFAQGDRVTLNGRLDAFPFTDGSSDPLHIVLTGLSDVSAGEPTYDGSAFRNADGEKLPTLSYNRPLMLDGPATLFVLDRDADKAFVGYRGGFKPFFVNPFGGLRAQHAIECATDADHAAVTWDRDKDQPVNADGRALVHIGNEDVGGPSPVGALLGPQWYLDEASNTAYQMVPGLPRDGMLTWTMGDVIRAGAK